ncbi:MAG TPA: HU family DNA-binding protein [Polyangia bacterium]
MTKAELIQRVYRSKGLPSDVTKKAVGLVIEAAFAEIGTYFVKAKVTRKTQPRFTYPGFGTFTKKRREQRQGRNPQTGEVLEIPASTTITFTPGQELRGELNKR